MIFGRPAARRSEPVRRPTSRPTADGLCALVDEDRAARPGGRLEQGLLVADRGHRVLKTGDEVELTVMNRAGVIELVGRQVRAQDRPRIDADDIGQHGQLERSVRFEQRLRPVELRGERGDDVIPGESRGIGVHGRYPTRATDAADGAVTPASSMPASCQAERRSRTMTPSDRSFTGLGDRRAVIKPSSR